ncbi:hypothetical protein [Pelagibius sp.]|uniref:hypothetical protein n=1 Tax=Pelagibius sp. TaxID=1931238 RepID=UPI0026172AA6|nr:hypothetical protein [Pelagibius sp.]
MTKRIAVLGALGILAVLVAFSLSQEGQRTLAHITGEPQSEALVNPNTGEAVTLEAIQNEAEWRKDTAEKLRNID